MRVVKQYSLLLENINHGLLSDPIDLIGNPRAFPAMVCTIAFAPMSIAPEPTGGIQDSMNINNRLHSIQWRIWLFSY